MTNSQRSGKVTIGTIMWVIFIVAIGLAVIKHAATPTYLWYWIGGLLAVSVLEWLWFVIFPRHVIPWLAAEDEALERIWLDRVLSVPSFGPSELKAIPRYMLMVRAQHDRRYDESESLARQILVDAGSVLMTHGFESIVRQRLAETLDALGRGDEAVIERNRAKACLKGKEDDFLSFQAQGKLHQRENRHDEAYASFEQGLALVPPDKTDIRAEFMIHLVLSSDNAGRPHDTIRWADAIMGIKTKPFYLQAALRMAGVSLGNLGNYDEAERYAQLAANNAPTVKERSECLATAASYAIQRGALEDAELRALEAEGLSPGIGRHPWIVIGLLERCRGRYAEEDVAMMQALAVLPGPLPSYERRIVAVIKRAQAFPVAMLGRLDEALALLNEAEPDIGNDPKLGPGLDARFAFVHALRGERDEALSRLESADRRRQAVLGSRTTQVDILSDLGYTCLALDDPARALTFWQAYSEVATDPVQRPTAFYQVAECHRLLGDIETAMPLYQAAAAIEYGTLDERLARERLAELDAVGPLADPSTPGHHEV